MSSSSSRCHLVKVPTNSWHAATAELFCFIRMCLVQQQWLTSSLSVSLGTKRCLANVILSKTLFSHVSAAYARPIQWKGPGHSQFISRGQVFIHTQVLLIGAIKNKLLTKNKMKGHFFPAFRMLCQSVPPTSWRMIVIWNQPLLTITVLEWSHRATRHNRAEMTRGWEWGGLSPPDSSPLC